MKKGNQKDANAVALGSKGGKARAAALTSEEKQTIARKAAGKRWFGRDVKPIKASRAGLIRLGTAEIPCANLPDGRRVLSETAILTALGRTYSGYYSQRDAASGSSGASARHRSVSPAVLAPFIPAELEAMLVRPIAYFPAEKMTAAKGVPAEALPMILQVWMDARDAGVLTPRQREVADKAEILYRGLANTGIVALVDEATGAQFERGRDALARFLESYVTQELSKWERTFNDDFYKQMFRLRGWDVSTFQKRPGVVGKWTTDIVYKRLAPGVLQRLQEIVPRDEKGRLKFRLFQALTRDKGYMALREHLAKVTTIMELADDWDWFMAKLDRLHPRYDDQLLLPFLTAPAPRDDDE